MHQRKRVAIAAVFSAALVVGGLSACGPNKAATGGRSEASKSEATHHKAAGPAKSFGQGTYKVGKDVQAGTYRTDGPSSADMPNCYWARAKDASGELTSIIANDLPMGPASVTLKSGEYVSTHGCKDWTKQ